MKSGKQRSAELLAKKNRRAANAATAGGVPVNPRAWAPHNSYGGKRPGSIVDGVYTDLPFKCVGCGKAEIWTAARQQWWYEVAKGVIHSTARRCAACRRQERERRAEARRVHLEGLARKRGLRKDGAP
jgi:hypothetical protein